MPLAPKTPAVFPCWLSLWLRLASAPLNSLSRGWIQPGLLGLMDGSVSTLAPILATARLTGRPLKRVLCGTCGYQHGVFRRRCPTTEALPDAAARCDVVP